jgi:hypothetical protein
MNANRLIDDLRKIICTEKDAQVPAVLTTASQRGGKFPA